VSAHILYIYVNCNATPKQKIERQIDSHLTYIYIVTREPLYQTLSCSSHLTHMYVLQQKL